MYVPHSENMMNFTHHLQQYHEVEHAILKAAKSSPHKSRQKKQPNVKYFIKILYP